MSGRGSGQSGRSIALAAASLVVIAVIFYVYTIVETPAPLTPTADQPLPPPPPPVVVEESDAPSQSVNLGGRTSVSLKNVGRSEVPLYRPDSDQPWATLSWDKVEPIDEDRYSVTMPDVRLSPQSGQNIRITAADGIVHYQGGGSEQLQVRRMQLGGGVTILVDRLNERERAALPEDERRQVTGDRLITLKLDDLDFDSERSEVSSEGAVSIQAAEADLTGTGLFVRYNEVAGGLERVEIRKNLVLVARSAGDLFATSMSGVMEEPEEGGSAPQPAASARQDVAQRKVIPHAGEPLPDDGIPLLVDDTKKGDKFDQESYAATFHDEVRVTNRRGDEELGGLQADQLRVLFDLGKIRSSRESSKGGATAESGNVSSDAAGVAPVPADDAGIDETEMRLTCAGAMVILPHDDTVEPDTPRLGDRIHISAEGQPVELTDATGRAEGRRFVYQLEQKRGWLYGDETYAAQAEQPDNGRVVGRSIFFSADDREVTVQGPGRMTRIDGKDANAAGDAKAGVGATIGEVSRFDVSFETIAAIRFSTEPIAKDGAPAGVGDDSTSGGDVAAKRGSREPYLASAIFIGGAEIQIDGDTIAADRIDAFFAPPQEAGEQAGELDRLIADGHVQLDLRDDHVTCPHLELTMHADEAGWRHQGTIIAEGPVLALRNQRRIESGERMRLLIEQPGKEIPAWDQALAEAEAVRRGLSPADVDWAKQRAMHESQRPYENRFNLRKVDAYGGVLIDDPADDMRIAAFELMCTLDETGTIASALLTGTDETPAVAVLPDFGVSGREIELDAADEWAHVPGKGWMTFRTQRDIDGTQLDSPTNVRVEWSMFMTFRGRDKNQAVFEGKVHASSDTHEIESARLTVDFRDLPPEEQPQKPDKPIYVLTWQKVREYFTGESASDRDRISVAAPKFNKEPASLLAEGGSEGNAVATTHNNDPESGRLVSRARVEGPVIAADLLNEVMNIDGRGFLLIEDYQLPKPKSAAGASSGDSGGPFGQAGLKVDRLPSQTLITASRGMSYDYRRRTAVFDQDVDLSYTSGALIHQLDAFLGPAANEIRAMGKGNDAELTGERMTIVFARSDPNSPRSSTRGDSTGLGRFDMNDVERFDVTGGITFQEIGFDVTGQTVEYERALNRFVIRGTEFQPATVSDRRRGIQDSEADYIYYNTQTGQFSAPNLRIRSR